MRKKDTSARAVRLRGASRVFVVPMEKEPAGAIHRRGGRSLIIISIISGYVQEPPPLLAETLKSKGGIASLVQRDLMRKCRNECFFLAGGSISS